MFPDLIFVLVEYLHDRTDGLVDGMVIQGMYFQEVMATLPKVLKSS